MSTTMLLEQSMSLLTSDIKSNNSSVAMCNSKLGQCNAFFDRVVTHGTNNQARPRRFGSSEKATVTTQMTKN